VVDVSVAMVEVALHMEGSGFGHMQLIVTSVLPIALCRCVHFDVPIDGKGPETLEYSIQLNVVLGNGPNPHHSAPPVCT